MDLMNIFVNVSGLSCWPNWKQCTFWTRWQTAPSIIVTVTHCKISGSVLRGAHEPQPGLMSLLSSICSSIEESKHCSLWIPQRENVSSHAPLLYTRHVMRTNIKPHFVLKVYLMWRFYSCAFNINIIMEWDSAEFLLIFKVPLHQKRPIP